ncbi:MAG TPA: LodA/GoxA family CTQ-dependent oxidase [Thermoanaerobaculia bacterium]|jgi:hypothetical protein
MNVNDVAFCKVHPAIGIARVGGSTTAYCIGPEVPGEDRSAPVVRAMSPNDPPPPTKGYKDESGLLLRQAARFRIYGYDKQGNVLGEVQPGDGVEVQWSVHLANTKPAWYDFCLAMDIPAYATTTPSTKRNAGTVDRSQLTIDPGPRSIAGRKTSGDPYKFTGGMFFGKEVPLGELQTDEEGRLIVLGGVGDSANKDGLPADTFANNEGWHDDTSDGPVEATVIVNGKGIPVQHGWVVVAPPDYAPGLIAVVTFHDIIRDVFWQEDPSAWMPKRLSFQRDLLPIFDRLIRNQWVNAGFGQDYNYMQSVMETLADNSTDPNTSGAPAARVMIFQQFRNPDYATQEALAIPPVYGDDMNVPATDSPRQWMAVTKMMYEMLTQWSLGNFDSDYDPDAQPPQQLEAYPVAEQPQVLDFSALDNTIGGPFHPGCEMTWPMRHRMMYDAPFRIKLRKAPEPDYGAALDQKTALGPNGPLDGSLAGSISRWMAVPWQTDTSSCLYAYELFGTPGIYLPTFWPVRVPNSVVTEQAYAIINDPSRPPAERQVAFSYESRPFWLRALPQDPYTAMINAFVTQFNEVGVITQQAGPPDKMFPSPMHVEMGMNIPVTPMVTAAKVPTTAVLTAEQAPSAQPSAGPRHLPNPRDIR